MTTDGVQRDRDLAVADLAKRPGVLALDPRRAPTVRNPGVVQHPRLGLDHQLDPLRDRAVDDRGIPPAVNQEVLQRLVLDRPAAHPRHVCRAGAGPRFPTRSSFRPSPSWRARCASRRPGGGSRARPCLAPRLRRQLRVPHAPARARPGVRAAVSAQIGVFGPETTFTVPERRPGRGRPPSVARPDGNSESVRALAERLPAAAFKTVACRTTPTGEIVHGRFAFVRVVAAHAVTDDHRPPRWQWLIIEWPEDRDAPTDYWLSNLPEDTARAARAARPPALDDRARLPPAQGRTRTRPLRGPQLPRIPPHCALVTCTHAFLTLEQLCPKARSA